MFTFCKNNNVKENQVFSEDKELKSDTILDKRTNKTNYDFVDELEQNEELVSNQNFELWKGVYMQTFDYTDNDYNEYVFHSEVNLIKPDSCYFEYWYEILESSPTKKNNHTKIFGKVYPSSNNNMKIQFFENKMIIGESPEQSPVFTLISRQMIFYLQFSNNTT
ncbi:MAG: hypothetical protein HC854_13360 [Flavobacterium sp.]|nr:hypothetical protein [Flavobacterium sp.]